MRKITQAQFEGTTAELQARVSAFVKARKAHAKTVGVPAPREEDWIEELVRSGEPFEVVEPPPAPPAPKPPTLADVKVVAHQRINLARDRAIAAGVTYGGHTFQADLVSRADLTARLAAYEAGVPMPAAFSWRASDNTDVKMALDDLKGLAGAMLAAMDSAYAKSWQLKAQIDAATDAAEIDAVQW